MGFEHKWVLPDIDEMICWTGVSIQHGALDGKPGSLSCHWKKTDPWYDNVIAHAMPYSRFLQLKGYMKLNNNCTEKKRGTPEYNPCCKYDMIYKLLVHNINDYTKKQRILIHQWMNPLGNLEVTWVRQVGIWWISHSPKVRLTHGMSISFYCITLPEWRIYFPRWTNNHAVGA